MSNTLKSTAFQSVRSVAAVFLGYVALVLGSTFVQETMFGGVTFQHSPLSTLILAGILTPLSAVVAGSVTAMIAGRSYFYHVLPLCFWITAETTFLYTRHIVDGPLWFEGGAGVALIVGAMIGAFLYESLVSARPQEPHSAAGLL